MERREIIKGKRGKETGRLNRIGRRRGNRREERREKEWRKKVEK